MTKPPNYDQDPAFEEIIDVLIEKTKQGKIRWEATGKQSIFVSAVKGARTFTVGLVHYVDPDGRQSVDPTLSVADSDGELLFEMQKEEVRPLYSLAKRVALHIDERVSETLDVLHGV